MQKIVQKIVAAILSLFLNTAWACDADCQWFKLEKKARSQTVYFYAWGGHPQVNDYLSWASQEIEQQFGVTLVHVKVADISEAIAIILSEKAAGRNHHGRADLLWVNGENFAALKRADLLFGPFAHQLPNDQLVDKKLPVNVDFATPVEGLEAPWGVGQLVMMFDQAITPKPPASANELLEYARTHPGRISYPQPPQFHGITFLKQLLTELVVDAEALKQPISDINFDEVTQPLWDYLDQLHKVSWYKGRRFPQSDRHMMQLLDDKELHMAISFNPAEAMAAVNRGDLADTVSSYGFNHGSLTNIHFLAIPYNSSAKEGAQVVANFLLSPKAQERKADLTIWGDPPVLRQDLMNVPKEATARFQSISEPHYSWHGALAKAWLTRYGYQ